MKEGWSDSEGVREVEVKLVLGMVREWDWVRVKEWEGYERDV